MPHQILQVLANGQKYTNQQLCQRLALKPVQLESMINSLSRYGIQLQASSVEKTYQLLEPLELLEVSKIWAQMGCEVQQHLKSIESIKIFETIESTNHYALNHSDLPIPSVYLAEYQTAGRGRQGRQWFSPYASGLCLSIKQHYTCLSQPLTGLTPALVVSVVRVLHQLGASEVGIKWPNDILWQGRKLAGLLLETRYEKGYDVVIGIGINVKMPFLDTPTIEQPWVDLTTILGCPILRNLLAAKLIEQCLQTLIIYPDTGLSTFHGDWHHFDLTYGQIIKLNLPPMTDSFLKPNKQKKSTISGIAYGIDEEGALLLKVGNDWQRHKVGEVSLRL
jgi:BirA family biotin operon repressor/biotin-[acetyl-CoA-carboxylase] ligase